MNPSVSVIIPTYNRAPLVTAALESVLAQTFQNFEVIVVDDGSTDNTAARLAVYMDRIRYIHQPNRGASAAQNAGLREARGEWVAILASDDVWHPTKLQRQVDAVENLGNGFGACFTDCRFVGNPKMLASAFEEAGIQIDSEFGPLPDPLRYVWEGKYGLFVQSLLARRSLMNAVGGFDEELSYSEDRDLIFKLSFRTEFCCVTSVLVDIDRTESTPRLTGSGELWDVPGLLSYELSLRKMLEYPELKDSTIRQRIEEEVQKFYENFAAGGIRSLDLRSIRMGIQRMHQDGRSYLQIWSRILMRAARKVLRAANAKL